ncbi:MAG: efflux RND transporter permease subunit [Rhodospirillales bacterium]|nr:efflux RND transporter permease subunit [Rhodospirillales bacterium]
MWLSDLSVTRPVFSAVLALLLIAFGLVAYERLPLREYPDIDPPVVSVEVAYPGASATVVESRITELIEGRIAGIEGIESISSSSRDGRSDVVIEFNVSRDIDAAANDVRDRVSGILDNLPPEADPPEIQKVDSNQDVIMWLNLTNTEMTVPELTDYANRYLVDRFSILDGVARARVGGQQGYAMRIWLDRQALAARGLTANDVEMALRAENVELPAGSIESYTTQFGVRIERSFRTAQDFANLVLARGEDGYLIRLGDVGEVELGTEEDRTFFRGNRVPMVGIGIVKQSTANTVEVARLVHDEAVRLNRVLPSGMSIEQSYDTSVFIESAIDEVYKTLFIAIALVVLVIFLFLGSFRAMLVPAVTVPVSLIATFIVLLILGFSVNLLTLLAMVLAIGMVIDDAVVVLENIHRRILQYGESPLVAAFEGTREVGFAVIATTLVLIAVFVPIAFLEGNVGRLFSEFALTMAAAVAFSSLVALSLSPMLASQLLAPREKERALARIVDRVFQAVRRIYAITLVAALRLRWLVVLIFVFSVAATAWLYKQIPNEHAPKEDRGAFFVLVNGPEGATYAFMEDYMNEIEARLMPLVESGEITRLLVRAPRAFGTIETFNHGIVIIVLNDWGERRSGWAIMGDIRARLADLPGVVAFPVMRQGFGQRVKKPVQFVIGGGGWDELVEWRDIFLTALEKDNPGLIGIDYDYKETKPQLKVEIDYDRAAELGVTVSAIGRTLETMLGSRRVTTFIDSGEEYDVILEGDRSNQNTADDLTNIHVRSDRSGALIPLSNLLTVTESAASNSLDRYNRIRAITIEANLADGLALGDALSHLEMLVDANLPEEVIVDYKGQSLELRHSSESLLFVFVLGILVVFLVLAAQFESWIHPLVIMLTVPLAVGGGLLGIYSTGGTLNLYSQIGLIMLIGLAAKNGILIVEFANRLRDAGRAFDDALYEAALTRLRPIIMTSITTAAGAIPLILSGGAGAETRFVIGVVVLAGVLVSTFLTLYVVPVAYGLLARRTGSPGAVRRRLEAERRSSSLGKEAAE